MVDFVDIRHGWRIAVPGAPRPAGLAGGAEQLPRNRVAADTIYP
jgi:hypothetical protein